MIIAAYPCIRIRKRKKKKKRDREKGRHNKLQKITSILKKESIGTLRRTFQIQKFTSMWKSLLAVTNTSNAPANMKQPC